MTRIASINLNNLNNQVMFAGQFIPSQAKTDSKRDDKASVQYLDNLAMINSPSVKKVGNTQEELS